MTGTVLALTLASLQAGLPPETAERPVPRLSVTVGIGTVTGGPADTLVDDMRRAGLDEREDVFCLFFCDDRRPYPQVTRRNRRGPASIAAGVSYRMGGRSDGAWTWGVRFTASQDDFSRVIGYRTFPFAYLTVDSTAFVGSAMLMATVKDVVRVAAGPSINSLRVGSRANQWAHRPGVVLEAAVMVPIRRHLFLDIAMQSRHIPDTRFGPHDISFGPGGGTLPRRDLPFRHFQITAGVGFRNN